MEEVVKFQNYKKEQLFGIVHIPDHRKSHHLRVGINLLNPGIKCRVAPNRLNVKLARELCSKGFFVLRFDPHGIGDSEGELGSGEPIHSLWGRIQRGCFVPDVHCANRLFLEKYDLAKIILIGNCGGAINALLASQNTPKIHALVLIDLPITFDDQDSRLSFSAKINAGGEFADSVFFYYTRNLLRTRSWWRLITCRSDFSAITAALKKKFCKKALRVDVRNERFDIKAINMLAVNALDSFLKSGGKVIFLLAGTDPNTAILQNKFFPVYHMHAPYDTGQLKIVVIDKANHIYSLYEWQKRLFDEIFNWITNVC